MYGGVIVCEP